MLELLAVALVLVPQGWGGQRSEPVQPDKARAAAEVLGLDFTDEEIELLGRGLASNLRFARGLQAYGVPNPTPPALLFDPLLGRREPPQVEPLALGDLPLLEVERPADVEELAYADITTLSSLIRTGKVTCVELAQLSLDRLAGIDESLTCVVTLMPERALEQAAALDQELARGNWRGPLHGIPWGAKDILATRGYPTTWGAKPFIEQEFDFDAAVVERLDRAGAVLVAKLATGALAVDDRWFGGQTKNPWRPSQGSGGSSAGPAAATAAGGVAFSIGSETWGSIVSPSEVCGNSSLRPTFGRVSRYGAMTLGWSLDKLGPICRSARDAELVYAALRGPDPRDPSTMSPVRPDPKAVVRGTRIGVPKGAFAEDSPQAGIPAQLELLGITLVEVDLPEYPTVQMMITIMNAESALAFDEFTRGDLDNEFESGGPMNRVDGFKQAQFIPAVEYLRANQLRARLVIDMAATMAKVDALVHPTMFGNLVTLTNLTGQPSVVLPAGFNEDGTPFGISFTGRPDGDTLVLALGKAWQEATDHHQKHPDF